MFKFSSGTIYSRNRTAFFAIFLISIAFFAPSLVIAQTESPSSSEVVLIQDTVTTVKARVADVLNQEERKIPGTDVVQTYQTIRAEILEGEKKGELVEVQNDFLSLERGEAFYLMITVRGDSGDTLYSVVEPYRLPIVLFFVALFIILVLLFGGIQGVRGLLSLIGSLVLIIYVLIPGILGGLSPILVSLGVSSLIIIVGSYITHGFNKTTSSAVVGMIVTVVITGLLAYFAVGEARLSGFTSEEAVYLNFDTRGSIDFVGLLLSGILIGLLGVLYDVAIGQAISVEELNRVAPHLSRGTIYKRAIRIGREHIGALVNTLAIAYVGVSLPLLLLYVKSSTGSLGLTLNREIFATEIIRTMIGSIGLVVAVPITTAIAVWFLIKIKDGHGHAGQSGTGAVDQKKIGEEKRAIEHFGHSH